MPQVSDNTCTLRFFSLALHFTLIDYIVGTRLTTACIVMDLAYVLTLLICCIDNIACLKL